MGLDTHSLVSLRSALATEYWNRIAYITSDSRIDFQTNLEESLKTENYPEHKFNFLVSEKDKIKSTIEKNKYPLTSEEWLLGINRLIDSKLSEIDLSAFEMSNQVNIDLFLSIIEKGEEFKDYAKLYQKRISKANSDEWDDIIHQIGMMSKSNALFWDDFDHRFDYGALDRSDHSNLKLIFALGKDFYKNLNTKLYLVLNKNLASENENLVVEALIAVLHSFISKEEDILKTTRRIKEWYDDNLEDITYKLLFKKIMGNDEEISKNMLEKMSYEFITKLAIVNDKITDYSFKGQDEKYSVNPTYENLAIIKQHQQYLFDLYTHLKGEFISNETPWPVFQGVFKKGMFIRKVRLAQKITNQDIQFFIDQVIKPVLITEYGNKKRAMDCFSTFKGESINSNSLSSPRQITDIRKDIRNLLNAASTILKPKI